MKQSINLQWLNSNQKLLCSGNIYNTAIAYMDTIYSTGTLLQPMAGGPIGSVNNRNHVGISRASTGGAGFSSPRRAAPH
jgi:hypothetical protein